MRNIWIVMKKELARVFKDPKLVITTIFLPGLMIFLLYTLMGSFMNTGSSQEAYQVYVKNIPISFKEQLEKNDMNMIFIELDEQDTVEEISKKVLDKTIDYVLIFSSDFEANIGTKDATITYFFNNTNTLSNEINSLIVVELEKYRFDLLKEDIGEEKAEVFQLQALDMFEEKQLISSVIAMLLPFLLITFLFSGALSVGPESIAGDKERGTIATLLVTPTKRSHIALGKIISLSVITTLSAISSFIGILLSLPNLTGLSTNQANIYSTGDYAMILITLVSTVLVVIGLISVFSALAKNVKEASTYSLPIYFISMLIGMTSMRGVAVTNDVLYLIPIFNSVNVFTNIMTFNIEMTQLIFTIISNVLSFIILTVILTKEFNSERLMFNN